MFAHNHGDDVPLGTVSLLSGFGHLAGWAVLYSMGISLALAEFLDRPIGWLGCLYVTLCAHGGYLLDRVKFRNQDLDPADLMAEPVRHLFLRRHAGWIRLLMMIEWTLAVVIGAMISPPLGALVVAGVAAGIGYAGWKPGGVSRLKDLAGLKGVLVSGAVTGLATAAVLQGEFGTLIHDPSVVWMIAGMGLMVLGDAVICDLDDQLSDDAYGTRSLPVLIGGGLAGMAGVGSLLLGSLVLAVKHRGVSAWTFGALSVLSGLLILLKTQRRRDLIDGRMLVIVVIAYLVGF